MLHRVVRPDPPPELEALMDDHVEFIGSLGLKGSRAKQDEAAAQRRILRGATPDQLRAAGAAAMLKGAIRWGSTSEAVVRFIARKDLPWTVEDAEWLLGRTVRLCDASDRFTPGAGIYSEEDFRLTLAVAGRFAGHPGFRPDVEHLVARLEDSSNLSPQMLRRIRVPLQSLLVAPEDAVVPASLQHDADGYAPSAREVLRRHDADTARAVAAHLEAFGDAVRPTTGWRRTARVLAAEQPQAVPLARELVALAVSAPDVREVFSGYATRHLLVDESLRIARGALWMLSEAAPDADAVPLVREAALRGGIGVGGSGGNSLCQGLATSAVAALGSMAGSDPAGVVAALGQIRDRVPNKTVRKGIDAALEEAADRAGLSRGELVERSVPTLGLDADGRAEVALGDRTALLQLTGDATPKLEIRWRDAADKVTTTVPAAVKETHGEGLADLRKTAAEAKKLAALQRRRVEDLLALGRAWTAQDWAELYVGHPIVGWTARGLVWTASCDGQPDVSGLPERDDTGDAWRLRSHDGTANEVTRDARLRLWHPLEADRDEVQRWRAHLLDTSTRQPFKQAFREVYRLTPAEEQTDTYSNRFAGHVLRYPQAGALMRARDWNAKHLGFWDEGYNGDAVKTFTDTAWRAHFYYDLIEGEEGPYAVATLCSSDQVRFETREGEGPRATWTTRRLRDVPPLLLSEVMRDVDLFVGVTSVAADPTWSDQGTERTRAYWDAMSFGALGESAEIRREALERLLPRTRLAGRARIDGRFLVVDGSRRTYKIHLGSGNILMSPDDRYLCIVTDRSAKTSKVYLPFEEGGGMLSVILSKAFLLADDARITDPTILSQLR
jgi:hypothetical protein